MNNSTNSSSSKIYPIEVKSSFNSDNCICSSPSLSNKTKLDLYFISFSSGKNFFKLSSLKRTLLNSAITSFAGYFGRPSIRVGLGPNAPSIFC